jgi:photosystem II stability/assembly factor-like uncharacterized protein
MKHSFVLYLFSLICLPVILSAQTITRQFEETRYNIKDLHMLDTLHGWATGEVHWDTAAHQRTGTILQTVNGGVDWHAQTVPVNVDLRDVHFTDWFHGWAVGDSGTVLNTGDGGQHWNLQTLPTMFNLSSVFFTDSLKGWVSGNEPIHFSFDEPDAWKSYVWNTSDGGSTWSGQQLPEESGLIHSLFFQDSLRGWAVGVKNDSLNALDQSFGVAYATEDGGQTWVEKFNPGLELVFTDIDFVDDNRGWIIGFASKSSENGGNIFRTEDGGESWSRIAEAANETLWKVEFIDSLRGFACGAKYGAAWGPPVLRSTDGGRNWELIRMEEHNDHGLFGLAVFDNSVLAMGDRGYLVQSTDPWGDTSQYDPVDLFTQRLIDTLYEFEDIFFIDQLRGWVVGRKSIGPQDWAQTILHSKDGGWTWEEQYSFRSESLWRTTLRLNAVEFVNASTGWACGFVVDVGASTTTGMLHTVDGGQTWEQQVTGVGYGQIVDLFMLDEQSGWALTNESYRPEGTLDSYVQALRTDDSGENWELINTGQTGLITIGYAIRSGSLYFQDPDTGWILGARCNLYKTTNGGDTWDTVPLPLDWTNTLDLKFSSRQYGTICGESVFHTHDGGDHWTEVPSINRIFTDMHFTDSLQGWMVGEWGNIYRSNDGGSTWDAVDHEATSAALKAITFPNEFDGWAAGRGGTILKIEDIATAIEFTPQYQGRREQLHIFPNPSGSLTTISYVTAQRGPVKLSIYDLSGRHLTVLVNELKPAGTHAVQWDGTDEAGKRLSPGSYICRLTCGKDTRSSILVLIQSD